MIDNFILSNKRIYSFICISVFANAMGFFGFLYEEIDFIPNYFINPLNAKIHWNQFHVYTNPAHYHIIPSIVAIICLIALWFYNQNFSIVQTKKLKIVSINTVLINCITGIAVLFINNKLFFDEPVNNSQILILLAVTWAILNMMRLILLGLNIIYLMKFFQINLVLKGKNSD